jgi:ribonuclease P protein component
MISSEFSRQVRLLTAEDYSKVFGKADAKAQSGQILILAHRNDLGYARVGLVVAKKHAKRAVDRNQFKRIVRESFRHNQSKLENYDCVVLSRPGAKDLDKLQLRLMIDKLWTRLRQNPNGNRPRKKREDQKN